MFLLLVDQDSLSSADLQGMLEQSLTGTDVVNCYSTETLLKVAEKLTPDIIIVDLDLVSGNINDIFNSLRHNNRDAHVLALIDPDFYEKLLTVIEAGGVDDYIVKPIRKEDFMARVHIAAKRKNIVGSKSAKSYPATDEGNLITAYSFDEAQDETESKIEDEFFETGPVSEKISVPLFDEPELPFDEPEQPETPVPVDEFSKKDNLTETTDTAFSYEAFGNPEEDEPDELLFSAEEDESAVSKDIDLFEADILSMDQPKEAAEDPFDLGFDDFTPESGGKTEISGKSASAVPDSGFALFDDDSAAEVSEDDDIVSLFDDDIFEEKPRQTRDPVKSFEDIIAGDPEEIADWELPPKKSGVPVPEPGAAVVKPAAEFPQQPDLQQLKETKPVQPSESENYFDDLFADQPAGHTIPQKTQPTLSDFEEVDFDAAFAEQPQPREDLRPQSDLPGKSADDFLYGQSGHQETDDSYSKSLLNDFDGFDDDEPAERGRSKKPKRSGGAFGKTASVIGNIVFVCLLLLMATLSFFLIQSRISGGVPQVAGYQMYIVLSGSMSPEFDTGSLAFVREVEPLGIVVGDIVTFRSQTGSDSLTTHRVVEVLREDGLRFVTRGDANNVNDPNAVLAENVVGTVTGSVPYLGYLMNFVQTRQGLILLIFVPGVLIIVFELGKIMKYLTQGESGGKRKKRGKKYSRLAED